MSIYAWLEDCNDVQVRVLSVKLNVLRNGNLILAYVPVLYAYTCQYFNSHFLSPLMVAGFSEVALYGCSRSLVLDTTKSSTLAEEVFKNLLSSVGRDLLQSEKLNLDLNQKTTQQHHRRLRKLCSFTVD